MGVAENDVLDTEPTEENEPNEGELQDGDPGEEEGSEGGAGAAEEGGEDEDVVQLGEEEPPASGEETKAAPAWVKELRQRQRELARENAELKAKLGSGQPVQQKPQLPAKPKLADYDFDEEKFEQARDAWDAKMRDIDAWEANQKAQAEEQRKAVEAIQAEYAKSKQTLKVRDFQEAEDEVIAATTEWQRGVLVRAPATLVYALGRNPKKLQELASIKDPVKFAMAVGKLETEVKVTKRQSTKPAPETTVRGSSSSSATNSKATLERLEAEADRTGDRSKVIAYKRQQRLAGNK